MEEVIVTVGFSALSGTLSRWPKGCRGILVSTESAYNRYGAAIEQACEQAAWSCGRYLFPCGEEAKELTEVQRCWAAMQELRLDRKSVVMSLGGGALTDVGGFAASCYMRGIDHIAIPTTLLAMIDAAIGGKNGVNFGDQKNALGTFHMAQTVYANLACLETLPQRELCAGLAEAIKYGFIWDPTLLSFLKTHMNALMERREQPLTELVRRCIKIKQEVVKQDPRDEGLRSILNFGHTAGHALERALGDTILHGEAVAIGMNIAVRLGVRLQITPVEVAHELQMLCEQAGLPTTLPNGLTIKDLIPWMKRDKKSVQGRLSFVLLRKPGEAELIQNLTDEWIE